VFLSRAAFSHAEPEAGEVDGRTGVREAQLMWSPCAACGSCYFRITAIGVQGAEEFDQSRSV
jgi:hypothetical protein